MASRSTRILAAGLAAGVTTLALGAVPATAATSELAFDCTVSLLGQKQFKTIADTDLPATMPWGATVPVKFTANVTVPADVAETARTFFGGQVEGTTTVKNTLGGVALPDATATIPLTTIAPNAPLALTVSGSAADFTATELGSNAIKIASYDSALTFTKADGTKQGPLNVPCVAPAGADTTVDTVEVVQATTETTAKAKANKKKNVIKAKVKVLTTEGAAAPGDVKVIVKKGSKKAAKPATVELDDKGVAKVKFKNASGFGAGKYTLTAKYKGTDEAAKSKTKVTFKIK